MVRDPIDRAWSHAKKDLARERGRDPRDVTDDEWLEFMSRPYQRSCGDYQTIHNRWLSHIPRERLFVGRYRDVIERPHELLLSVMKFLGLRSDDRYVTELATTRVQATAEEEPPAAVAKFLEEQFGAERDRLRRDGWI